jgi:hypothetical protein
VALGPAFPEVLHANDTFPGAIAAIESVFFGRLMTLPEGGISLDAVWA